MFYHGVFITLYNENENYKVKNTFYDNSNLRSVFAVYNVFSLIEQSSCMAHEALTNVRMHYSQLLTHFTQNQNE